MSFTLSVRDFENESTDIGKCNYVIVSVMNNKQADAYISLQNLAVSEIKQEINILSKRGLVNELPQRDNSILFLLVYNEDNLIAYGYSHNDYNAPSTCCINTIFVCEDWRGIGLSKFILNELIHENIQRQSSLKYVKGVTQPDNERAINLLTSKGFKYSK
jgi:GNAT superfamily N-acetyltransferase